MNGNETENEPLETRKIRPRNRWEDLLATTEYHGAWYSAEEVQELERRHEVNQTNYRNALRKGWEESEHGKLCLAFYAAFQAYKKYCETHEAAKWVPHGPSMDTAGYAEHDLFKEGLRLAETYRREREEKLRKNLEKAQRAARCQHQYLNGEQCGAPRMKGKKLCRMHERMEEAKAVKLDLGPMEDPDSIQVGIKKLQGAIIDGKLDSKQIGHLAYTIQLAAWNVMRTTMVNQNAGAEERE
jgi:hypothetical protein